MDRKTIYDKLSEMSLDPPTEFPRTQCLNRPITYREACIDYVKKTMPCVGYRDYIVSELDKLERIEQIVNEWNNDAGHSFSDMCKINGILKE